MLKTLLRVQLLALKHQMTGGARRKRRPSKISALGIVALLIYAFGTFGFLFFENFSMLAGPFHAAGFDWLYFTMALISCFGLMFIGSIFTAKAQLYEAKDNDLLLSLPVPPRDILLSRLLLLWIITLFFGLLVAVPVLLAWQAAVGFAGAQLAAYLLLFVLLLPLFSLAVSALFGWLVHLATARVGKKSLVTVVLSLLFLGAYMYAVMNMNILIQKLAQDPSPAADKLGAIAPLYMAGVSVAQERFDLLLVITAVVLALFAVTLWLLSRTFIKTATDRRSGAKKKYVERSTAALSPKRALLRREWKRFLASPAYILNCGLGSILLMIGAVVLFIERGKIEPILQMEGIGGLLPWLFLLGLCFTGGMSMVTAASISLEGKSLWVVRSLPVDTRDVLKAKLRLHEQISLPPLLLCVLAALLILRPALPLLLCFLLLPPVFSLFAGLVGLAENLRHPNLDWTNETQAVKSSMAVLFTMLIAWGLTALPVLAAVFLSDYVSFEAIALAFTALLAVGSFLLYRWLLRGGAARFENL